MCQLDTASVIREKGDSDGENDTASVIREKGDSDGENVPMRSSCKSFSQLVIHGGGSSPWWVVSSLG